MTSRAEDVIIRRLHGTLAAAAEAGPKDFPDLLLVPGVGARTVRSLAMVAEVIHGAPCRFADPARFSLAHGGKDRHPFPVPTKVYDKTIGVLKSAVAKAKLGNDEKLGAIRRLDEQARRLERHASGPSLGSFVAEERARSHEYGGRSVFGWEPPQAAHQLQSVAHGAERPSAAFVPSGPPPWAMSGRPPPPCPPTASTALRTRSTALRLRREIVGDADRDGGAAVIDRDQSDHARADALLGLVDQAAQALGVHAFEHLADEAVAADLLRARRLGRCGRRPAPAPSSPRRARARGGGGPRARRRLGPGTSSGEALSVGGGLLEPVLALGQPEARRLAGQRLDPADAGGDARFRE